MYDGKNNIKTIKFLSWYKKESEEYYYMGHLFSMKEVGDKNNCDFMRWCWKGARTDETMHGEGEADRGQIYYHEKRP